ncbi:flippase [Haladaptatus salinisoli]|uniref:flippase n=1 Tax=Haladaptatus salinisoli TaxID=2884876 RepID=UPI001D0A15FB|nr:flippase [Haladaptatus salinisoli]
MADQSSDSYSPLRSLSRGASFFMVGKGLDNGLRFLITLVLARGLGGVLFSVYSFSFILLQFVEVLTNLGTDQSIMKFVPQYEDAPRKRRRMLGLAYLTSLVAGVVVAAALYFAAPVVTRFADEAYRPYLTGVLRVLALVLPLNTLTNCIKSVFKGLELPEYQVFIMNVLIPITRFAAVGIALLLGYQIFGVVAATVAATVLVFVAAVWLVLTRTDLRPSFRASRSEVVEFYDFSLPLTLNQAGYVLSNRVDILMVGFLGAYIASPDAAGIYRSATVLAGLLILPLSAFSQLFPPIASRMYSDGRMGDLESLYRRVTRWSFTMALFPAVGAIVYSNELLTLFGDGFTKGQGVLLLFVVAQLTNASVGPSGYVLMMTDHHYLTLVNQWVLGAFNVALNYLFIQQFGLIGAAVASATVIAAVNLLRIAEVWYTEGLFPYSVKYAKPVFAAAAAALVMYGSKYFLTGPVSLPVSGALAALVLGAIGGVLGLAAFAAVLYALGIEREDREFFADYLPS